MWHGLQIRASGSLAKETGLPAKRLDHPVRIVFPNVPMSGDDGKFYVENRRGIHTWFVWANLIFLALKERNTLARGETPGTNAYKNTGAMKCQAE